MLLLKLLLTPLIIGAVTLVGRRWGPRMAGLVIGLPVTSGPISMFLAMDRGPAFAARAAAGTVAGLIGTGCFCAMYAVVARRRSWLFALAGGLAALLAVTLVLQLSRLPLGEVVPLAIATLVLLWAAVSRLTAGVQAGAPAKAPAPAWDLPARVIVSTTMVASVTGAAGMLGAQLSGVLSALPVFGAVLGAFTQHGEGSRAAVMMMRGLIIGCVSAVLFFAVVGTLLAHGALPGTTYGAAALTAIATGMMVTHLTRPRTRTEAGALEPA